MTPRLPGSRIDAAFRGRDSPCLVACVVAGDPDYGTSLGLVRALEAGGADIIELMMPFSDPVADGPVIQAAAVRALEAGMTTDRLLDLVRDIRAGSEIPLVILTYANIVVQRGIGRFYAEAKVAGVDGIAVADLPVEESGPFCRAAARSGIDQILFVSQTTSPERLDRIVTHARGFLYLIAVLGVTGTRGTVDPRTLECIREVKERTNLPVLPGFGISSPVQVHAYAQAGAAGVIIGSAIVGEAARYLDRREEMGEAVRRVIRGMRQPAE